MNLDLNNIVWRGTDGSVVSCFEKNKVMLENLEELRQLAQDALDDAVLIGCDENQVRTVLTELMQGLVSAYPQSAS